MWESGLTAVGITDSSLAPQLAEHFSKRRAMYFRPYPDVLPTLAQLTQRYRLGLITNGLPDLQRTKLRCAGLDRSFSPMVISGELGIGKPAALAYQHLLDALRLPAEQTLLVEDSLSNIEGAAQLGMPTVYVARGQASSVPYTMSSLWELTMRLGC